MSAPVDERIGYSAALANREFRGITIAQVVSESGDQVARIALAVLVFQDQNSIALTALTYAVSYLPIVLGGALLGPFADRMPRRRVMLACHAARAVLVALIALPGIPLVAAFALLAGVTLFEAPFNSARSALIPDLIPDGRVYVTAVSLGRALNQVDQAIGFFLGGLVVGLASPRTALLVDSAAFIVAFIVVMVTVKRRPAALAARRGNYFTELREGARVVFGDRVRRSLVLLAWLGGFTLILPEGLAVIYAHDEGGGGVAAGLLTAAGPLGVFLGIVLLTRFVPTRRQADLLIAMQAMAAVLLALTAARPPIWATFLLWMASGAMQAYIVPAIALFNLAVPADSRGRAVGLAAAGLALSQGVALAGGGLLAAGIGAAPAVAWSAVLGLAGLAVLRAFWPYSELGDVADRVLAPLPGARAELALSETRGGLAG